MQANTGILSFMSGKIRSCFSFMHYEFVNLTCKNTVLLNSFSGNTNYVLCVFIITLF